MSALGLSNLIHLDKWNVLSNSRFVTSISRASSYFYTALLTVCSTKKKQNENFFGLLLSATNLCVLITTQRVHRIIMESSNCFYFFKKQFKYVQQFGVSKQFVRCDLKNISFNFQNIFCFSNFLGKKLFPIRLCWCWLELWSWCKSWPNSRR